MAVDPPIDLDHLNTHTFNFIPDRRGRLYQNAQCIAPKNNLFGCHSMWRSVCEVSYRCGSNGRPVFCRGVKNFGYPVPEQNGTRTFEEACEDAETEWIELFGDRNAN